MKNILQKISCIIILTIAFQASGQTGKTSYKIMAGVRVNPLLIYDLEGQVVQKTLLHAELGTLFNGKFYTSLGYTAGVNAVYNFNEYWFLDFKHKLPVSWVIAEAYNLSHQKFFIQSGLNFKLSPIGNLFIFAFTPTQEFKLGLKIGVFIPLNVLLKKA